MHLFGLLSTLVTEREAFQKRRLKGKHKCKLSIQWESKGVALPSSFLQISKHAPAHTEAENNGMNNIPHQKCDKTKWLTYSASLLTSLFSHHTVTDMG